MTENNNRYNTTAGGQSPADAQPHASGLRTTPRPRRKHSTVHVYINQLIATAICAAILWVGAIAIPDGGRLWFISDEITSMGVIPDDPDDPKNIRYNELLDERVEIGDSSWIGYLLVQAGGHWVTQTIRLVALLAITFAAVPFAIYLIAYMICVDIKFIFRKISKRLRFNLKPRVKECNGGKRLTKKVRPRERRAQMSKAEKDLVKA